MLANKSLGNTSNFSASLILLALIMISIGCQPAMSPIPVTVTRNVPTGISATSMPTVFTSTPSPDVTATITLIPSAVPLPTSDTPYPEEWLAFVDRGVSERDPTLISFIRVDGSGLLQPKMFEKFYSMVEDTLVWSPDGQYLLFDWSDFGLTMTRIPVFHLADLTLGKISLIASNQIWVVPSWAPEGKYIVTSQVTTIVDSQGSQQSVINLFTINALTSINERLTITSSADLYPSYSPNGRWIAFVRYSSDALTPKPGSGANCPFTPNNYGGCNIADLYIIDRNDGKPLLLLKSIYVQIDQYLRDSSYNAPSWSPDSQWLAVLTGNEQPDITLVNIKSVETRVLAPHSGLDIYPTWSPDGNKLAFVSNREGNEEIYLISPDGTGLVNLTNNVGNDFNPVWSPSGRYIAFLSNREGGTHLYVMKADGTDQRKLRDGYVITRPAWFPLVGVDLKEYFDLENK